MRLGHSIGVALLICTLGAQAVRKNKYIVPGAEWRDTDGNVISAHAGGITFHDGKWYWVGQNERPDRSELFSGLNLYSSPDLLNWDFEGQALSPVPDTLIGPNTVVERPKIIYSEETKSWNLWFHSDNSSYGLLRQGVATSPNITGPYELLNIFNPLGGPSQDFGLFHDVDGSAYALYSNGDADESHDNIIAKLNSNFTNLEQVTYEFFDFDLEAPFILYTGKRYYIFMSHKTGYRPNDVNYFSAEKISGPWSIQSYVAPLGTRTFNSQSTLGITVNGSHQTTYIWGGDQWTTASDLWDSRYIWLPGSINDEIAEFKIEWHDLYSIDVKTGIVHYPEGKTYEAEHGQWTGTASATVCPTCSGNKIVKDIQGNATLTINNISGTGQPQWVSIYYHNPDGLFGNNRGVSGNRFVLNRWATVSVNGGTPQTLRQRDTNAGVILSTPLNITFNEGSNNYITIAGLNGTKASDIDRIVVYGNIYND